MKINLVTKARPSLQIDIKNLTIDEAIQLESSLCTQIDVNNTLDYCTERDQKLSILINKLRYGGLITLNGTDFLDVCKELVNERISKEDAEKLLYNSRTSCSTLEHVTQLLKQYGLNIERSSLEGHIYILAARRPHATN